MIISIREFSIYDVWEFLPNKYKDIDTTYVVNAFLTQHDRALQYNTKNGVTMDSRIGELSRPSRKEDIENYDNKKQVFEWEFMPCINNSISRMLRGYEP